MPTIKGSTHRHILLQMNVLVRDGKVVDRNTLESDTLQNLRLEKLYNIATTIALMEVHFRIFSV